MLGYTRTISLTRRLVGQYLVFGLGCLLLCLATIQVSAFRGELNLLIPLAACAPVLILALGGVIVYQSLRMHAAVEEQLRRISLPHNGKLRLQPLPGSDPVASGWNALLEQLATHDMWQRLEDRLANAVAHSDYDRAARVFRQLPLATAVTDAGGNIILANQAFLCLADCDHEDDVLGRQLTEVAQFGTAANGDAISTRLSGYRGALTLDVYRGQQLQDGVLRVNRSPLPGEVKDSAQDVWILRDVTQQLLAEDMRNQFVFTATHELRTPLGNIKAYAEMLEVEKGIDVEKQKEFCNIINSEASRLSRFVDELLNISQMEVGSLSLNRHETDLEQLLADVLGNVRPEMEKKRIELETKFPAKWPTLTLDKSKIESSLVNLLGNAAKYTPDEGRVTLEIDFDDARVNIQVEDTGIGIAEQDLSRIFDKFYRSDDERVRQIPGNGLGLAFAHEVARLHGGRMSVHSEMGKGSRFTFTLPRT